MQERSVILGKDRELYMELQSLVEGRKNWRSDGKMGFMYYMLHINLYYIICMFLRA